MSDDNLPGAGTPAEPGPTLGADRKTQWFAADYVRRLRFEAAEHRTRANAAETKLAAAETKLAAGDPAAMKAEVRELKVSQALTETALRLGANPRLTKATLLMDGHLTGLDPDKADFLPALEALVETAIENDTALKGAAPSTHPVRSGSDIVHSPALNEPKAPITREDIGLMKAEGRVEEIAALYRTGQLAHLMGGN